MIIALHTLIGVEPVISLIVSVKKLTSQKY